MASGGSDNRGAYVVDMSQGDNKARSDDGQIHYNYIEPSYSDHDAPRDPLDLRLSDSNLRTPQTDLEEAYLRNSLARQKRPLNLEDIRFADDSDAEVTSQTDDVIPSKKPNLSEDENRNVAAEMDKTKLKSEKLPSSGVESMDENDQAFKDDFESDLDAETHQVNTSGSSESEHEHDEPDGRIIIDDVIIDDDDDVVSRVHVEKTVTYRTETVSVYKEILSPRPPRKGEPRVFRWETRDKSRSTSQLDDAAENLFDSEYKSASVDDLLDPKPKKPSPPPRKPKPDLRDRSQSPKPNVKPKPNLKPKPNFKESPLASPRSSPVPTTRKGTQGSPRSSPSVSPPSSPKPLWRKTERPDSWTKPKPQVARPVPSKRPDVIPRNEPKMPADTVKSDDPPRDEQSSDSGIFETPLLKPSQAAKFWAQKAEKPDVAAKPKVAMRVPKPNREAQPCEITIQSTKPAVKPRGVKPSVGPKIPSTELWARPSGSPDVSKDNEYSGDVHPKVDTSNDNAVLPSTDSNSAQTVSKPTELRMTMSISEPNLKAAQDSAVKIPESQSQENINSTANDNRPQSTTKPRKWEPVLRSHYKSPFQHADLPPADKPLQRSSVGGPTWEEMRNKIELARTAFFAKELGLEPDPAAEQPPQLPSSAPPDESTGDSVTETDDNEQEVVEQTAGSDDDDTSDTSGSSVVEMDTKPAPTPVVQTVPTSGSTDSGFASYLGPVETDIDTVQISTGEAVKPSPKKKVTFQIEEGTYPVDRDQTDPIECLMSGTAPIASLNEPDLDLPAMDDSFDEESTRVDVVRPTHINTLIDRGQAEGVTMEVDSSETETETDDDPGSSDDEEVKVDASEPDVTLKQTIIPEPTVIETPSAVTVEMNVEPAVPPDNWWIRPKPAETDIDAEVEPVNRPNLLHSEPNTDIGHEQSTESRPNSDALHQHSTESRPQPGTDTDSSESGTGNNSTERLQTNFDVDESRPVDIKSNEFSPVHISSQPVTIELDSSSPPALQGPEATLELPQEMTVPNSEMNLESLETMIMTMPSATIEMPSDEGNILVPPPQATVEAPSIKFNTEESAFSPLKPRVETSIDDYEKKQKVSSSDSESISSFEPQDSSRHEDAMTDKTLTSSDTSPMKNDDIMTLEYEPRRWGPPSDEEVELRVRNDPKLARSVSEVVELTDQKFGPRESTDEKLDPNWDRRSGTSSIIRPTGDSESHNVEVVPVAEEERLLAAAMARGSEGQHDDSIEQEDLVYECFLEENRGNIRRLEAGIRRERDTILNDLGKKPDERAYNEPPSPGRNKTPIGTHDIFTAMAMSSLGVRRYARSKDQQPPNSTSGSVGGVTAMSYQRRREEEAKTQPVRILPFQTSRNQVPYGPRGGPPGYRQAPPRGHAPRSNYGGSQYSYGSMGPRYRAPSYGGPPAPQEFPGGRVPSQSSRPEPEPKPGPSGYSTYPQKPLPPGATPLKVEHWTKGPGNQRTVEADIAPRIDRRPDYQSAPPDSRDQEIKRTSRLEMQDDKRVVKPPPEPRSRQKTVTPGEVMTSSLERGEHKPFTTNVVEESKTKTYEGTKKVVKKTFAQRQTSVDTSETPSNAPLGVQEKVDRVVNLVRDVKSHVRRETNIDDLEDHWSTPTKVQRGQSPGRNHSPGRGQSPGRNSYGRSPSRNGSNAVMFVTTQPVKPTEAGLIQAEMRMHSSPKVKDDAICVRYKSDPKDMSATDTSSESLHSGRARSRSKERPSSVIEVEVVHLDSPKYKPRDQQKRREDNKDKEKRDPSPNIMNESFSSVSSVNECYERKTVRTPKKSPKFESRPRPRSQEFDSSLDEEVAEIHAHADEYGRPRELRTPEFQTTTRIHNNASAVHETTMDAVIHDVVHEQMTDMFGPDQNTPKHDFDDKKKAMSSPFKSLFYRSKRKGKDGSLNSSFEGSVTSERSRPKSPGSDEKEPRKRSKSPFEEYKEWRNRPKSPAEIEKEERRRKRKEEEQEKKREEKERRERERKEAEEKKEKEKKESQEKREREKKELEEKKLKEKRELEEKKEKEKREQEEAKERKLREKKEAKAKKKRTESEERGDKKPKNDEKEKPSSSKDKKDEKDRSKAKDQKSKDKDEKTKEVPIKKERSRSSSSSKDDSDKKSRDSSSEYDPGYEKVEFRRPEKTETEKPKVTSEKSKKTVITSTSKGEIKREEVEKESTPKKKTVEEANRELKEDRSKASDGIPVYAKVDRTRKTKRGESSSSSETREVRFTNNTSVPPSADASFVTNGNTSLAWDGHYSVEEVLFDDTAFSGLEASFDESLLDRNARRGEVFKMLSEDPTLEEKIRRVAAKRARELNNESMTESELNRTTSQESLTDEEIRILEAKITQYFEIQKSKRIQMLLKKFLAEEEGRLSKILSQSDEMLNLIAKKDRELYGSVDLGAPAPEATPPKSKRTVLYNESAAHFEDLDTMVIEVAKLETSNFADLVQELTVNCQDEMDKLRAIYRWVTVKDLDRIELDDDSSSSLTELLRGIKDGTESYHTLFKKLCAYVGLHCQIIHGYSKGAGYRPGMNIEHPHFRNTWTAVYMNGSWRFVNCNWGARHYKSDTDDDKLTYKCDEFYFLTDPQDHIYQHYPDDEKWQLLTNPISISQFMRLPVAKSPFFNAGLTFSHKYDDRLRTEDGRCEIALKMSKFVGFHCVLERFEDGNIIAEPEECTLIRTRDNSVIFTVAPPDIGKYYFNIYVAHDWKSNSLEHACAFQIIAGDDCYDNLSNGVFPNVGTIGRTPVLDYLGIQLPRGLDPLIMMDWRSDTILPMTVPNDIRLSHQMKLYNKEGKLIGDFDQYAFLRSGRAYSVHLPKEGIYALTIFASDARERNSKMECILKYLLDCESPNPDLQPFPKASRRWVGCTLYEPLQGQLEVNAVVRFKIDIPHAVEVTVVIDDRWENLEFSERLQDVWEGSVDVGENPGRLGVYARFEEKSDKFSPMLDYSIVKRK